MRRPTVLIDLRADCRPLLNELTQSFDIIPLAPLAPLSSAPVWTDTDPIGDPPLQQILDGLWPQVGGAVAYVQALEPKPTACILWNTCNPLQAATAIACRDRGIPTYEINHSRIATRLVGHFECGSQANHVVSSRHFVDFLASNGCDQGLALGQPGYDLWQPRDKSEVREALGLPSEGTLILKTSTWLHCYSEWIAGDYYDAHEVALNTALGQLQKKYGAQILWTTRGLYPDEQKQKLCDGLVDRYGIEPGSVLVTDDTPIRDLVDAADLVLSQKSGVAIDAVMSQRPALQVDFRPPADDWAYLDRGVLIAHNLDEVMPLASSLLEGNPEFNQQQIDNRRYWGGAGDAGHLLVERILETL